MEVHIEDVIATVRTVSADALLTPRAAETIVTAVLGALDARQEHQGRLDADRKLLASAGSGVEGEV
jgi:hypothetical protein